MDGLPWEEMCFDVCSEGRDERLARPILNKWTRGPRVPTCMAPAQSSSSWYFLRRA
jgi:hypothetical protein